ncbi:hypothetical protein Y12382J_2760 [Mycoplasmoides pneumoniae]|uniref:MPN579 family protein n=1 Tax=Mycoplasmoides pneumoniae TaxID=2104 RepID=UPI0006BA3A39|nr:hypothetical protein [Mycoplasmoides pneumoniae]ARQ38267.1 hypothetical protein BIX67_03310 [Mycoplasmoides pneumoniae]GLL59670.1 hypothetical protein Y12382J_2760 [Mycoplasmoides pneumoniae]
MENKEQNNTDQLQTGDLNKARKLHKCYLWLFVVSLIIWLGFISLFFLYYLPISLVIALVVIAFIFVLVFLGFLETLRKNINQEEEFLRLEGLLITSPTDTQSAIHKDNQ